MATDITSRLVEPPQKNIAWSNQGMLEQTSFIMLDKFYKAFLLLQENIIVNRDNAIQNTWNVLTEYDFDVQGPLPVVESDFFPDGHEVKVLIENYASTLPLDVLTVEFFIQALNTWDAAITISPATGTNNTPNVAYVEAPNATDSSRDHILIAKYGQEQVAGPNVLTEQTINYRTVQPQRLTRVRVRFDNGDQSRGRIRVLTRATALAA